MNPFIFFLWFLFLIPSVFFELLSYVVAPLVAMCVRKEERTDRVKQIDNGQHTLMRDYLWKPLMWFQTHDNAVDEWWYGAFNRNSVFKFAREATQSTYDNSAVFRWFCRLMWLWRNVGYGFLYNLLGRPVGILIQRKEHGTKAGTKFWYLYQGYTTYFQFESQIPVGFGRNININIGWKPHKGFPRVLYANRAFGLHKDK